MLVQRISSSAELEQLADQWNCIARGVPFRSWAWLRSWWRNYSDDGELYVLAVRDPGGQLVGLAPFYLDRSVARGRVVRFLGSGEVCSDYPTVLSTLEHEDAVAAAVAKWLIKASATAARDGSNGDRWDLLELTGVDAADRATARLAEHFESEGYCVHRRAGANCWRIDLPETWDEYLSMLSKTQRKQLRRLEQRVLGGGDAVVRLVRSADELPRGMEILKDLHQRRWQRLGKPGCFASPRFSGFLHEAAKLLLEAGQLRLHWIELHGRPAAAAINVVGADIAYAYQSGMDPDALDQSPGTLTQLVGVKMALDEGHRAFDLLRGDEPYKANWRARPRPSVELRVAAKRAVAQVRHGAWRAGDAVKCWIKSGLGRPRPAAAEKTTRPKPPREDGKLSPVGENRAEREGVST